MVKYLLNIVKAIAILKNDCNFATDIVFIHFNKQFKFHYYD